MSAGKPPVEASTEAPMSSIRGDSLHGHVPEKILRHAYDADDAMKAFEGRDGEVIEIDEATNKRLLRIIDWNLMPILCIIYGLQYLDKTTLSYASIMELKTDIALEGDDYQCEKASSGSMITQGI
jgi:ACS family allantoate permease-like MFS transporter